MRKKHFCFLCFRKAFRGIHLVDKCLILFMLVLLFQLTFSMFFQSKIPFELSHIDVIVRTSAASIFGYFLSANFIRHASEKNETELQSLQLDESMVVEYTPKKELPSASKIQIIVATVIGLICLISLIILRNIVAFNENLVANSSISATVAQFRDFVSGCVGFLIGCPTNPKE